MRGRGRGKTRGTGRGRGGRRGGRVFKGQQFEEGEEERLRHLQEERREKADVSCNALFIKIIMLPYL